MRGNDSLVAFVKFPVVVSARIQKPGSHNLKATSFSRLVSGKPTDPLFYLIRSDFHLQEEMDRSQRSYYMILSGLFPQSHTCPLVLPLCVSILLGCTSTNLILCTYTPLSVLLIPQGKVFVKHFCLLSHLNTMICLLLNYYCKCKVYRQFSLSINFSI